MVNGKQIFSNKKELTSFWFRNALDQSDLTVKFFGSSYGKGKARTNFSAFFYTYRSCKISTVSGRIYLDIDENGKILKLTQESQSIERQAFVYGLSHLRKRLIDPPYIAIKRAVRPIWRSISTVVQVSLYIIMWVGILLILYVEILHDSLKWLSAEITSDVKRYTPFWFAGAYIIQQTISFVKQRIIHDVHFIPIDGEEDLKWMRKFIHGADRVEIVSGDFSFLDTDSDLQSRLKELAYAKKLSLVSYKSSEKVKSELKVKSVGRDVLFKLEQDNSISYDFPVEAKITIVTHGRNRKMLFRYWRDEDGDQRRYMGVVRETQNTGALLDVITKLIDKSKL